MFDGLAEESISAVSDKISVEDKTVSTFEIAEYFTVHSGTETAGAEGVTPTTPSTPLRHPNQLGHGHARTPLELSPILDDQRRTGSVQIMLLGKSKDTLQNTQESAREWSGFASDEFSDDRSKEISFAFGEGSPIRATEEEEEIP